MFCRVAQMNPKNPWRDKAIAFYVPGLFKGAKKLQLAARRTVS